VVYHERVTNEVRNESNGNRAPNGYYLFSITVELGKRIEPIKVNGIWRGGEKVYVKEVNTLKEPQEAALEAIKRSGG
jgi:hypothetical protein